MKALTILFGSITICSAQVRTYHAAVPPPMTPLEIYQGRLLQESRYFAPAHLWRFIDGAAVQARGPQWVQIVGKIDNVNMKKRTIRLTGWYGAPMTWPAKAEYLTVGENGITNFIPTVAAFTVTNFPVELLRAGFITYADRCVAFLPSAPDLSSGKVQYVLNYGALTNASAPAATPSKQRPRTNGVVIVPGRAK